VSVLLIDGGNSRTKWALFDTGRITEQGVVSNHQRLDYEWPTPTTGTLFASVRHDEALVEVLQQQSDRPLHRLNAPQPELGDFTHCYVDPSRLGVDRWLAMLGAQAHTQEAALVVDAGTALTLDLLDANRAHLGGYIVPGLTMARQALFQGTDKVIAFDDEREQDSLAPGQSTLACVASGTLRQMAAFVGAVAEDHPGHRLMITGGDGSALAEALGARYYPDLIFDGMGTLCAGLFTA